MFRFLFKYPLETFSDGRLAFGARLRVEVVILAAKRHHVQGVVCGHIHKAEMREIDGILYCNDGDWVESCTALVEHPDGRLEILHWIDLMNRKASVSTPAAEPLAVGS